MLADGGDIERTGASGGTRGEFGLDDETGLHHLLRSDAVEEHEKIEGIEQNRGGGDVQISAVSDALGDDTHDFEHLQSLTQGRAGHAQHERKITLSGQAGSGYERSLRDELLEDADQARSYVGFARCHSATSGYPL